MAALLSAEKVVPHAFEEARYFEGCLPIEVMAERGEETLAHGPMKPVGLEDPRTGRRPYAVVQLRQEDLAGTAYNLVGFQTRLTWPEQRRVFRTLPGLAQAEFLRMGQIHRNTFIDAPRLLGPDLSLRAEPRVWFAGQISGVEGYVESAASGYLVALAVAARRQRAGVRASPGGDGARRALPARHRGGAPSRGRVPALERDLRALPSAARPGGEVRAPRGTCRAGPRRPPLLASGRRGGWRRAASRWSAR